MNIKIIIATHKKYYMPDENCYLPLHVGRSGNKNLGYVGDDTGDNISEKNPYFCELTGLYWAWKNLNYDYLGLAHYRRHFTIKSKIHHIVYGKKKDILSEVEISNLLVDADIILPQKRYYIIETLYSHYEHTHYIEHLEKVRDIMKLKYPDYLLFFEQTMKQRSGFMFNMFIMNKELLNEYCTWLFDILFELEKQCDTKGLTNFQGRFYGRVSEILFNVWLNHKVFTNNITVKKIKSMHLERINWFKKGSAFLRAKVFNFKYEGSF